MWPDNTVTWWWVGGYTRGPHLPYSAPTQILTMTDTSRPRRDAGHHADTHTSRARPKSVANARDHRANPSAANRLRLSPRPRSHHRMDRRISIC